MYFVCIYRNYEKSINKTSFMTPGPMYIYGNCAQNIN